MMRMNSILSFVVLCSLANALNNAANAITRSQMHWNAPRICKPLLFHVFPLITLILQSISSDSFMMGVVLKQ